MANQKTTKEEKKDGMQQQAETKAPAKEEVKPVYIPDGPSRNQ